MEEVKATKTGAKVENKTENKTEKARVMAGTYPASGGDQARKLLKVVEAAGLKGFKVEAAAGMPGYIQVVTECTNESEAKKLIREAAEKKITLCMTK